MPKNYTYTDAGVNRAQRVESKKQLSSLKETYRYIGFGGIMHLPTATSFQLDQTRFWILKSKV
ncbi:MAG TPA: hypothetical protein V6C97_12570 [Oculatellaceae cyanobacterium]